MGRHDGQADGASTAPGPVQAYGRLIRGPGAAEAARPGHAVPRVCQWRGCDRSAPVAVHSDPACAADSLYGVYCVAHGAIACGEVRRAFGVEPVLDFPRHPAPERQTDTG